MSLLDLTFEIMEETQASIVDIDDVVPRNPEHKCNIVKLVYADDESREQYQINKPKLNNGKNNCFDQVKYSPFPIVSKHCINKNDPEICFTSATDISAHDDIGLSSRSRQNRAYLQFSDLHYEVDVKVEKKRTTKRILKGLSGDCKPGHILAIMVCLC